MWSMVIIHDKRHIYAIPAAEFKTFWRQHMPYVAEPVEGHNEHVMRVTYGEHVRYIDMYGFKNVMSDIGEARLMAAIKRGKHEARYQKSMERRGARGAYRNR